MSKENHIDEMAIIISNAIQEWSNILPEKPCPVFVAEKIYNAGYRKQSEVAMEIFEKIENAIALMGICLNDETILYELKKKYTEGTDD